MALDLFKTTLLGAAEEALAKNATLARAAYRDLSDDFNAPSAQGETLRLTYIGKPAIRDVTPSGQQEATIHEATVTKVDLPLDQWKETVPFDITDKDSHETKMNQAVQIGTTYGGALGEYIENYQYLTLAREASFYTGNRHNSALVTNNSIANLAGIRRALNEADAPMDGRVFLLNNAGAEAVLLSDDFRRGDIRGAAGVQTGQTGVIGQKFGFGFMEGNNNTNVEAGGAGNFAVMGAHSEGDETVAVTGVTDGVNAGEVVTIGSAEYVVREGFTGSAGTLTLDRGLDADAGDTNAVTRRTPNNAYAGDPRSLAFAMRPTAPPEGPFGSNANVQSYTNPETGFSITVEISRGKGMNRIEFSALFGAVVGRPETIKRVIHS